MTDETADRGEQNRDEPEKGSPEWKQKEGKHLAKAEEKKLKDQEGISRRSLLTMGAAWGFFGLGLGTCSVAGARYMVPNVSFKPPQEFKAGYPTEYEEGMVETKYKAENRTWIVYTTNDVANNAPGFFALEAICTHLGCTPNWLGSQGIYKCPCHGSGYYKSGINFEGPAPRPMERYRIYQAADGLITVDKSTSFQYEKGGWDNLDAFLPASEVGLA